MEMKNLDWAIPKGTFPVNLHSNYYVLKSINTVCLYTDPLKHEHSVNKLIYR